MSSENTGIVRRSIEAFNEMDAEKLISVSDPECEFETFRAQLEGRAYHGHDGIRRFLHDAHEDWSTMRIEPLRFHERGDRVVVSARVTAQGRGSGVEVEFVAGFILDLRDKLVLRIKSFSDAATALEAAGLQE